MFIGKYRYFFIMPRYYRSERGISLKWLGFVMNHRYRNNKFK